MYTIHWQKSCKILKDGTIFHRITFLFLYPCSTCLLQFLHKLGNSISVHDDQYNDVFSRKYKHL